MAMQKQKEAEKMIGDKQKEAEAMVEAKQKELEDQANAQLAALENTDEMKKAREIQKQAEEMQQKAEAVQKQAEEAERMIEERKKQAHDAAAQQMDALKGTKVGGMLAEFGAKGQELMDSEAALEAQYQLRNKGNKAGRMAGALGAKFHMAQQDKYSFQYYEWTEVEIIDVFFRRCNKARN